MNDMLRLIFPVSLNSVRLADDLLAAIANNITSDQHLSYNIRTVLSESFNNAFLYGDKSKFDAVIEVRTCFKQNKFCVSVINEGSGFADIKENWDNFPSAQDESGRGLKIIKRLSDIVKFNKLGDNKFEVYVEFNLDKKREKTK
ncbi:MAG: ATP-binding protein [candidate division Zixibacteria bacterium]|nr:ATP-binding protein [candidate division Zixibacteria bacterium]